MPARFMTVILLLAATTISNLPAQNQEDSGEATLYLGWTFFDTSFIDNGYLYGGRLGTNLTDHVEFEIYFDQLPNSEDTQGLGLQFDVNSYGLDFLWNWGGKRKKHVPYLLFGLGRAYTNGDIDEDIDYLEAGGGWRFFVNELIGVRFDARALGSDDDGGFGTDNIDVKASAGLTFILGT